jgi:hypothetical protein
MALYFKQLQDAATVQRLTQNFFQQRHLLQPELQHSNSFFLYQVKAPAPMRHQSFTSALQHLEQPRGHSNCTALSEKRSLGPDHSPALS